MWASVRHFSSGCSVPSMATMTISEMHADKAVPEAAGACSARALRALAPAGVITPCPS